MRLSLSRLAVVAVCIVAAAAAVLPAGASALSGYHDAPVRRREMVSPPAPSADLHWLQVRQVALARHYRLG
jgi:hypothetical protein